MALKGPTLEMLGVPNNAYLDNERLQTLSLVLNGLIFAALMALTETSRSLDLRRGSAWLEALVPIHVLGALYLNARFHEPDYLGWDVALYWVGVGVLLVVCPMRSRRRFFLGGLLGLAAGSYLLLDLNLVDPVGFIVTTGLLGLVAAAVSYGWLSLRSRG